MIGGRGFFSKNAHFLIAFLMGPWYYARIRPPGGQFHNSKGKPMKKFLLLFSALLLVAAMAPLFAQDLASNEVYANTPFKIAADHDGLYTSTYRLYRDNVVVATLPSGALVGGLVTFDSLGLEAGTYVFQMSAVGDGGEATSSGFTVVVKVPAPNAPTMLRIIRIT
jgi:hypothetical protein